jgi:hypothetical protein
MGQGFDQYVEKSADLIAGSDFGRRAAPGPKGLRPGWPQQSHPLRHFAL